jgi:hypothetical protein
MATAAAAFTNSISEIYDRYRGRVLFERYARDLAARLAPPVAPRVLEVACGSGVASPQLRERRRARRSERTWPPRGDHDARSAPAAALRLARAAQPAARRGVEIRALALRRRRPG